MQICNFTHLFFVFHGRFRESAKSANARNLRSKIRTIPHSNLHRQLSDSLLLSHPITQTIKLQENLVLFFPGFFLFLILESDCRLTLIFRHRRCRQAAPPSPPPPALQCRGPPPLDDASRTILQTLRNRLALRISLRLNKTTPTALMRLLLRLGPTTSTITFNSTP